MLASFLFKVQLTLVLVFHCKEPVTGSKSRKALGLTATSCVCVLSKLFKAFIAALDDSVSKLERLTCPSVQGLKGGSYSRLCILSQSIQFVKKGVACV